MNNATAIGLALLTVVINGLIGHFFAPGGILLTPLVISATTFFVGYCTKNITVIFISILAFIFVALNDISIKLYAGGRHDNEGLMWTHLFLFIGLVPTSVILLIAVFRRKSARLTNKILALVLFAGLVWVHLLLFDDVGLGRSFWYEWNG